MAETKRNLEAIASANLAFTGATKLNTQYLMAKNKQLVNKLEAARQEVE